MRDAYPISNINNRIVTEIQLKMTLLVAIRSHMRFVVEPTRLSLITILSQGTMAAVVAV